MEEVKTECEACGGTGLYCGFAEPEGTAVMCLRCGGSGCAIIKYKPFVWRKERQGIHTVSRSKGSFILTGVGPCGGSVTYEEFQQGKDAVKRKAKRRR